jgi:mono/diheme cytochrome c family protein
MGGLSLAFTGSLMALVSAGAVKAQTTGAQLFSQNCAACHQPEGQGIKGAFPALAGDPFVASDPKVVASVLLHGRGGMPNFSEDLTDADIAAVLSYVRSSWGNHAGPVSAAAVASVRGKGAVADDGSSVLSSH